MKTAAQRIQTADTIELVPQILHLKKLLVPTDFSETSKKAVQYALRFAEQFGCEIALLYVVEPATPLVGAPLAVEPFTDKDEFSMAEKDLAALAAESHTTGAPSVSSFVRVGHAPNEITKAAKDLDVDGGIFVLAARPSASCAPRRVQYSLCAKKSTNSFNQVERSSCEYADKNSF